MKSLLGALVIATCCGLVVTSCNKHDVIESGDTGGGARPAFSGCSARATRVCDYTPAPGQFINDIAMGTLADVNEAANYAFERLAGEQFVSLGAFGGYIVVGFDHSIVNTGGYDFGIRGNNFDGSNEPGVVWVMQDTNRNGRPDDMWFQLAGSETGLPTATENYSVTYYRPDAPQQPTRWTDNRGNEGIVEYNRFHSQDYYYPAWIKADSYTLSGTLLHAKSELDDATGYWRNDSYDYGYVDNSGSDMLDGDPYKPTVGFKISNAIDARGDKVQLKYIDFVKVQSAVMSSNPILGEVSTEVVAIIDLSIME